jgi:prepilin-type N-terminal cleavage/methylation domain-containing protein
MKAENTIARQWSGWNNQRGFTLIELMVACVVLLVGIVAVAQLVPASIVSNSTNRNDSSATVFAQRELTQMASQPLNLPAFIEATGPCNAGCNLGDLTQSGQVVGSPVLAINNQAVIDFSAEPVIGYSFNYQDPNDPSGTTYDARWAVITTVSNGVVSSKRFIFGVTKRGGNGFYAPVTLDSLVQR